MCFKVEEMADLRILGSWENEDCFFSWLSQGQRGEHQEGDGNCAGALRDSGSSAGNARGGREAQL